LLHLGSIGGTSIDVDFSFVFIVGLWVANQYQQTRDLKVALLWAPVLFLSVLIHEFAHAAMIALFGYGSSSIILGGMGGVTYNRRKARPWHDLVISVAGPVSSFLLAYACLYLGGFPLFQKDPMLLVLMPTLAWANMLWGKFNLIPVSPLDGGHATRHFFSMFLRDRTAFIISVWIGMIVGTIVAIVLAVFREEYLIALLIGWFVYSNFQQWQYFRTHGYPGD